MSYTKDQIQTHYDGRERKPAINVKCYNFASERDAEGRYGAERLSAETGLQVARCEVLLERAEESARMDFWEFLAPEAANENLAKAFNLPEPFEQREMVVYGEGRSSGWLVVEFKPRGSLHGTPNALPELESWDAIKVSAWGRFEAQIKGEIEYLSSYANVKERLAEMGDLDPDSERNEARAKAERILAPYDFAIVDERSA